MFLGFGRRTLILSLNTLWRYFIDFRFSNVNGCSGPNEIITSSRTVVQTWGCRAKLKNRPPRSIPVASREGKKRLTSWSRRNLRSVVTLTSSESTEKTCDFEVTLTVVTTPLPSPCSPFLAVAPAFASSVNVSSLYLSTFLCTSAIDCLHSASRVARKYTKDTPAIAVLQPTPAMASSKDVRNCSASSFAESGSRVSGSSPKNLIEGSENCIITSEQFC